ncbi:MAG: hypothetical protein ACFB50_15580 [Rubrobacteraceae bacterium]
MEEDTAILVHGILIDPIEDSTSDNLNGLAELVDLCQEADLDTRLGIAPTGSAEPGGPAGLVLRLEATGPIEDVASTARQATTLAIYPDVGVASVSAGLRANRLLEGAVGVIVKPVEALPQTACAPPARSEE